MSRSLGEEATITVTVEGGVIQDISGIPDGVRVIVRDYDVDGSEEGFDEKEECVEWVWA